MRYEQHPLSAAFPAMGEKEFQELAADIKANGLRDSITLFEGKVLDGWHRLQACQKVEVNPRTQTFSGDPISYVLSKNAYRRNLTGSQRAEAVIACGKWKPRGNPALLASKPEAASGLSEAEMAKLANVSDRTIRDAKVGHDAGLGEGMKNGLVSAAGAAKIAKAPPAERKAAIRAIERGEKPAAAAKAKPAAVDNLHEQIAALVEERDDLQSRLAEMADDLSAAMKAAEGEEAATAEIKRLNALLRTTQGQRDDQMAKCAEMAKQIKMLERRLKKAA